MSRLPHEAIEYLDRPLLRTAIYERIEYEIGHNCFEVDSKHIGEILLFMAIKGCSIEIIQSNPGYEVCAYVGETHIYPSVKFSDDDLLNAVAKVFIDWWDNFYKCITPD